MKIYFDTCSLNRPLDDKSQLRVAIEAESILGLLALCESGTHEFVSSDVLLAEIARNPQPQRRAFVETVVKNAPVHIGMTEEIRLRAKTLEARGFGAFDALHVACAESDKVDYLCTCDDRLRKKAKRTTDLTVKVVSPLELAEKVA